MIPRRDIERRRSDTRLAILAINIVFCAFTLWLIIKTKKKEKKKVETKNGAEKKGGGKKAVTGENCMYIQGRRWKDVIGCDRWFDRNLKYPGSSE